MAVLGDEVKGKVLIAYVVLKTGVYPGPNIQTELKKWIREKIGPIADPKNIFVVRGLPKTRSGKIMRIVVKALALGEPVGDISTLEDESAVEDIKAAYEALAKELESTKN